MQYKEGGAEVDGFSWELPSKKLRLRFSLKYIKGKIKLKAV